jgi:ParG
MANATSWGKRPTSKEPASVPSVEEFVSGPEKTIRLNVLIPAELHKRVKAGCAMQGVTMSEIVLEFLQQRFPK